MVVIYQQEHRSTWECPEMGQIIKPVKGKLSAQDLGVFLGTGNIIVYSHVEAMESPKST